MSAGYGKVAVLDELQARLGVTHDRIVYMGDGSSDVHVMLHVNRRDGLTIAVSETKYIAQIARRTVLSDDALSVLVPVLEDIVGWDASQIRDVLRGARVPDPGVGQGPHRSADAPADRGGRRRGRRPRRSDRCLNGSAGWRRRCSSARTSSRPSRLLAVQVAGALTWLAYGVMTGQPPVIVSNVVVAGAAAFRMVAPRLAVRGGSRRLHSAWNRP